jgi:hypothetical protein
MFDNFETFLTDTALEKWETRIQNIALIDRTMERYTQVIENMEYVDPLSPGLHDQMLKDFRRPVHLRDHATQWKHSFDTRIIFRAPNRISLHNKQKMLICWSFP